MRPALLRRLRAGDEGFTLFELLAAMFIIVVVLTAMLGVYVSSMRTVSLAKQRDQASQLANQTMEELRALPYNVVAAGLNSTDPTLNHTSDPNISTTGLFQPLYAPAISEVLLENSSTKLPPLYPHLATVANAINNVKYTIATYVTQAVTTPPQFWLTVTVTWSSAATKHRTTQVATRTKLFQPSGCGATSHPYPGPCQAFFYGEASTTTGAITVAAADAGGNIVSGVDATEAQLTFPQIDATTQVEQISTAAGKITGSVASITSSSGTSAHGGNVATSSANTDPASGAGTPSASLGDALSPLSATGSPGTLTLTPWSSDTGTTASTTNASSSTNCVKPDGSAVTNGQACASSQVQQGGASPATIVLSLNSIGGRTLSPMTLASVASGSSWSGFNARYVQPGTAYCTTATGLGCTAAAIARSLGNVTVGALPSAQAGDSAPAGFNGIFSLTGYGDQASSQEGIWSSGTGAGPSSATVNGGTLSYWNGTGYSSVCLGGSSCTPPGSAPSIPEVVGYYADSSGSSFITVKIDTSLNLNGASSSSDGSSPCQSVACDGTYSAGPPTATLTYTITYNSTTVAHFNVNVDLGSVTAKATYKAAPSA